MHDEMKHMPAIVDGFDEYDDENGSAVIKGSKVKFTNECEWMCGEEEIEADREFLVIEILKLLQKWVPDQPGPAETRILAADEKFPDIDELNKEAPRDEWAEKFGQLRGPWQAATAVYLLDQQTMELLTFVSSTVGGGRAIRELRESTRLARRVQGPGHFPVVTLRDVHMPTRFGGRQRPHFAIQRFVAIGEPAMPRQITHEEQVKVEPEPSNSKGSAKAANNKAALNDALEAELLNDPLPANMTGNGGKAAKKQKRRSSHR